MSEYNIQMNKYNALNAEYDQLYPATKIENVDGLNTALQNNDPRQWGLGSSSGADVPENDCNNATKAGFYILSPDVANSPGWWAAMLVVPRNSYEVAQIVFKVNGAEIAERYSTNGSFSAWRKLSFQEKLTKIPLPSAGSMNANTTYAYYTRDQFGMVSVIIYGNATAEMPAGSDTQISLLPEGFRPSNQCTSVGWAQTGAQNFAPGAIWMKETGVINFRPSVVIPKNTYIFGQINFIAG